MSKIKCNQEKCKYNNCEHCMKDGIKVDENANCKSYEEGKHPDNSKFEFASFEREENSITCNATECLYNKNIVDSSGFFASSGVLESVMIRIIFFFNSFSGANNAIVLS